MRPLVPPFPTRRSSDLGGRRRGAARTAGGIRRGEAPARGVVSRGARLAGAGRPPRPSSRSVVGAQRVLDVLGARRDRKSTRLNSSHLVISYAIFCLKKK